MLEKFRLDGTVNEERYQDGLLGIQRRKYLEQLAVYAKFKKDQTVEALKVQNQLAEIESKTTRPLFTKETAPLAGRTPDAPASTQDNTDQKLAVQDIGENALLLALRSKFEKALITEQDYELKKLELKRLGLAEEIAILQAATVPQVEEIRKREEEKAKVEGQISQKRTDNEQRSEALRQRVQQEGIQATADLFSVAADLLAKDEAARKKNASAIKAFQSAQVVISGVAEVQKIWAGAASLGPIAGPIIGAIQTAVAVGRTVVAINKIQGAKFERGGAVRLAATPISGAATDQGVEIQQISPLRRLWAKAGLAAKPAASSTNTGHFDDGTQVAVKRDESLVVINKKNTPLLQRLSPAIEPMQRLLGKAGVFGGKPHSQGGTKGVFSDGTQIEVERDEAFVVVNHRNTPLLRALSAINAHNGNGVPFFAQRGVKFADGGIEFSKGISPSLNTNPLPLPAAQQSQQAGMEQVEALGRAVIRFEAVVASFPKEVKSRVVYQDIESAGALLDSVRDEAAI